MEMDTAKKIKADLIMKAKVKKQYAKVLKEEGMESTRLSRGDGEAGRVRMLEKKIKGKGRAMDEDEDSDSSDDGGITTKPSKINNKPSTSTPTSSKLSVFSSVNGNRNRPERPPKTDTQKPKSVRALSPSHLDIGPPLPQTSLRELKKEAFAKFHAPPRSRFGGYSTNGVGGSGRGQPKMGARMDALLEQIKRDKQSDSQ